MRTHVALLRGVNVGGRSRVAMAELRELVETLGGSEVATYVQSGNVVFASQETDTAKLAETLKRAIADRLDVRPEVIVLSREQLARVMADNPFPDETSPRCLHAVFRSQEMSPDELAAVAVAQERAQSMGSADQAEVVGRTLFLRTPDGLGRSQLGAQLTRTAATAGTGASGTARNWRTVTRLMDLLDA